jgi:hypothetical protein
MKLKDGWTEVDQSFANSAQKELAAEVPSTHQLSGIQAKAVARKEDRDDVLFELQDGSKRVAVVHLTYSGKPEQNKDWPMATLYSSYEEWLSAQH